MHMRPGPAVTSLPFLADCWRAMLLLLLTVLLPILLIVVLRHHVHYALMGRHVWRYMLV